MNNSQSGLPPESERQQAVVEEKYNQGLVFAQQRKFQQALAAFNSCLQVASENHTPLYIEQFINILMEVAFCHADLLNRDEALRTYISIEKLLKKEQDWFKLIPKGIEVVIPISYNPLPQLGSLYESMGIAYDNANDFMRASGYYQQAIDIFMQLDDKPRAARTCHYIAAGCRRREDWVTLQLVGENLLALHEPVGNLNGMIEAWQCLAQARMNQGYPLEMLEYQKLAVTAEKQINHPDSARDEKILNEFIENFSAHLRKKVISQQRPQKPNPFERGRVYPWPELFEKISVRKVVERGLPELVFVVHTQHFDAAAYLLHVFRMTLLPVNIPLLRQLPHVPGTEFPEGGYLMIEWSFADLDPGHVLDKTVIPQGLQDQLAEANSRSKGFTVILEEKSGRFGRIRSDTIPGTFEPYLIDWDGALGYVTYVRWAWRTVSKARVDLLLQAIQGRLASKGPATGLYTEMGYLYRLNEEWGKAIDCYLREIRFGLTQDGRPGVGTMQAFCNLGVIYKKTGEPARARDCFAVALHLNPNYFEPLISIAGVLDDLMMQLMCLSRAQRIRPDDPVIPVSIHNLCGVRLNAIEEVGRWVKDMSSEIDLSQPLSALDIGDPLPVLKRLGI